jgi:hypothetical protein
MKNVRELDWDSIFTWAALAIAWGSVAFLLIIGD